MKTKFKRVIGAVAVIALASVALLPTFVDAQSLTAPYGQKDQNNRTTGDVLQNAATATGNGTTVDVSRWATYALQFSGSASSPWNAVITVEGTLNDGTTWSALTCYPHGSSTGSALPQVAGTIYRCNVVGIPKVRARISTYTNGTITVTGWGTAQPFALGGVIY